MGPNFVRRYRNLWATAKLSLLVLFAAGLGLASAAPAFAAELLIDSIVIKLRDGAGVDPAGGLTSGEQAALFAELQTPFAYVGSTRDGALRLQLLNPLPLDAARAAVNRVRMLAQVLYANVVPPAPAVVADAAAVQTAPPAQPPVRHLIVKFRDPATVAVAQNNGVLPSAQLNLLSALAGQPISHERAMSGGAFVVRLFQAQPSDQARLLAAHLATDPTIEYAEPDLLMRPLLAPNDPRYPEQWHYMSPSVVAGGANLPPAWDLTTGSLGIVVAVLDTGYLPLHPDLAGRFIGGYDFISDCAFANDGQPGPCTWTNQTPDMNSRDSDASDPGDWVTSAENAGSSTQPPYHWFQGCGADTSSFHGSHVAGTIGAATGNSTGVAGINWISKILPVRVLGKCGGYTSDIIDAIRWSVGIPINGVPNPNPARVLNMSFGGGGACGAGSQSAINDALAHNAVVVVAAGNEATDASQSSPANCFGVITVAATGFAGQRAPYTNYGALVEIAAPGGASNDGLGGHYVLSTINDSATSPNLGSYTYALYQGTSMATPHVAGIASLMLSRSPALTPSQVLALIQTTARAFPTNTTFNCTTATCGAGIIDAAAAVIAAGGGQSTTTTALTSAPNPALVGASVTFTATVAGSNPTGSVSFAADGGAPLTGCNAVALSGTGNSRTASCLSSSLTIGTHSMVASYSGDGANAASVSPALAQVITDAPGNSNVALASAGAIASASTTFKATYPATAVNNNERAGLNLGNGGVWADATANAYPDWVQINFSGSKTISRVVVYSVQDNYANPIEPTDTQTFSLYGVTALTVEGWIASTSTWATLATVSGNNLVKRSLTFPAFTTDRIRVNVTNALASYSRITEIEAWGTAVASVSNVALASAGAIASASTTFKATYPATAVNNNERAGLNLGNGGVWADATANAYPDWVQINFSGSKTISRVVVYSVQDNYANPIEPTDTQTFSLYGVTALTVEGWIASTSTWATLATVSGNNLVKRSLTFPAFTTDRIRVNVTNALASYSRITEIEAWGTAVAGLLPTTTALTSAPNPALVGASVTFTATVAGSNPTGSVSFAADGGAPLAGCNAVALSGTGNSRTASCLSSSLAIGTHNMVASYSGDGANAASVSPALAQVITAR